MADTRRRIQEYRSLWLLLIVVAGVTAAVISSCGGGGSSNGGLCEQCGVSPDGPCQPSVEVVPGPDQPPPCNVEGSLPNPCRVELICRRKVDSAQQRCFPKDPNTADVNFQFRCDGSRPGGTAVPQKTSTPGPTATPSASSCGDGIIDAGEDCDGINLNGESCESQGCGSGTLLCLNCNFLFSECSSLGCR